MGFNLNKNVKEGAINIDEDINKVLDTIQAGIVYF